VEIIQDNSGSKPSGDLVPDSDLLIFLVQDVRIGIPAVMIDHVFRMVAVTPLHEAPPGIIGIINYHGEIFPVFSFRNYFSLQNKSLSPKDYLLIVQSERSLAIIADYIEGVFNLSGEIIPPEKIDPGIQGITGFYRCKDGLLVVTHPQDLISLTDQKKIQAMKEFLAI